MRYREINESINDKGIMKAVFLAGMPGAGKSTIASRITDGTVDPRYVNVDHAYEFLLKKHGKQADSVAWGLLGEPAKAMTEAKLVNYLNGMLPLFVDGTSANPSAVMRRTGIAESLGYDTAMIWVNVDLETAIKRVQQRERKVPTDFIESVYKTMAGNKELYKSKFNNFIEVDNNGDNFSAMESKVYTATQHFFSGAVSNPIGQRILDQKEKYLVPEVYSADYIKKVASIWYMS